MTNQLLSMLAYKRVEDWKTPFPFPKSWHVNSDWGYCPMSMGRCIFWLVVKNQGELENCAFCQLKASQGGHKAMGFCPGGGVFLWLIPIRAFYKNTHNKGIRRSFTTLDGSNSPNRLIFYVDFSKVLFKPV